MIPIILTMGCMLFICLGIAAASFAEVDIQEEGPDIKNLIMLVVGIAVIAFGIYCVTQANDYYNKKENPKKGDYHFSSSTD